MENFPSSKITSQIVLIVLDGWGIAPAGPGNPITQANIPYINSLFEKYINTKLHADGKWVGLPEGEVGSSETGHLTIGSGRAIYQDFSRINNALNSGSFYSNSSLVNAFEKAKRTGKNVHLMGLAGLGGVHSHRSHLYALLELARRFELKKEQILIHLFTDGRDTDPHSGVDFVAELEEVIAQKGVGYIASLMGRYWAMDRDRRWERTQKAYNALVNGEAVLYDSPKQALADFYDKNITDEFVEPVIFNKVPNPNFPKLIVDEDVLIHFNFRTDRARQLSKAFILKEFDSFKRSKFLPNLHFVSFVEYEKNLPVAAVAFRPTTIKDTLGEVLSARFIKQARVAETEKYAFVTYYFNGLCEDCIGTEENFLIPSPKVPTYDLQPEMSTPKISEKIMQLLDKGKHPFILVNFANPDMVGHTGDMQAAIKACESVNSALEKIVPNIISKGGIALITADHGNVEQMLDPFTGAKDTQHNPHPVPFLIVGKGFEKGIFNGTISSEGSLADVAPTVLHIMGVEKPTEMTGRNLLSF